MVLPATQDTRVNTSDGWPLYFDSNEYQDEQSFVFEKGYPSFDSMSSAESLLYAQVMAPHTLFSNTTRVGVDPTLPSLEKEVYLNRVCAHIGPFDPY